MVETFISESSGHAKRARSSPRKGLSGSCRAERSDRHDGYIMVLLSATLSLQVAYRSGVGSEVFA